MPNYLGHPDNYIIANPLKTPAHIVPEWYYLPFYAILRAITFNIGPIDSKLGGVLAMFGAIAVLFFVPWLDTSKVRSAVYRPWYKLFFWLFVANAIFLGWLGSRPAEGAYVIMSQLATLYYFGFFLVIMPLLGLIETPRRLPNSITEAVLDKNRRRCGAIRRARPPRRKPRADRTRILRGTFRMNRILSVLAVAGCCRCRRHRALPRPQEAHNAAEPTHFPIHKPTEESWTFAGRSAPTTRRSCSAA